jgi:hypothetical protein
MFICWYGWKLALVHHCNIFLTKWQDSVFLKLSPKNQAIIGESYSMPPWRSAVQLRSAKAKRSFYDLANDNATWQWRICSFTGSHRRQIKIVSPIRTQTSGIPTTAGCFFPIIPVHLEDQFASWQSFLAAGWFLCLFHISVLLENYKLAYCLFLLGAEGLQLQNPQPPQPMIINDKLVLWVWWFGIVGVATWW